MRSIYAAGAPLALRVAAVAQALEAVGLCVTAVAQVVEVATGHSYRASSGVGLAVTEFITVALITAIALGITQLRPWSRTPAVLTQLGCGLLAIILLQAHRLDWGLPTLIVAIVGLAGLFHPASLKALARPRPDPDPAVPAANAPAPPATPRKKKSAAR
jgi:hypothetical protein